jgi:NADPH:quinone reductase
MRVPEHMLAAVLGSQQEARQYFSVHKRPVPQPAEGECLIRVAAAGLNGATRKAGGYARPADSGDVLGLEVSGTVAAFGSDVDGLSIGDEVCALIPEGGYAEYCIAPARQILLKPRTVDLISAGGIMENLCTAWVSIFDACRTQPGERLLVHGGAGGLGLIAIQLAVSAGIEVIASAGSDDKCQVCLDYGAVRAINYRKEKIEIGLKEHIGVVDAILDIVGGAYLSAHIDLLSDGGRICVIGLKGGSDGTLDLGQMMRRRLTVTGSVVRSRSADDRARIVDCVHRMAWPLFEQGKLKIIVDSTFPLTEAQAAHERLESGAHIGKVLLIMNHSQ